MERKFKKRTMKLPAIFAILYALNLSGLERSPQTENSNSQATVATLVSSNLITDDQARLELAKLLSRNNHTLNEATALYQFLLHRSPNNPTLFLEISRVYLKQKKIQVALFYLYSAIGRDPENLDLLINAGDAELIDQLENSDLQGTDTSLISSNFITDDQARLELAKLLSKKDETLNEAVALYQFLLHRTPNDSALILEMSRIYLKQKKFQTALFYLYPAIQKDPENSDLLLEAAHAELSLGHPKESYELLRIAMPFSQNSSQILQDEVSVYMFVGDFYKAEEIYKILLESKPQSIDLMLSLAWSLVASQRYEEAEGLYKQILFNHPKDSKVLEALVSLKMLEKDFVSALEIVETLLCFSSQNPTYLELKADILFKSENYCEALETYEDLTQYPKFYVKAFIGKGKVFDKLNQLQEANKSFQIAYDADPSSIPAQFYYTWKVVDQKERIQQIIDQSKDPKDFIEWANIYAENGMNGILSFYQAALNIDPNYFPAQEGLAAALSANYLYEEAIEIYLSILEAFPNNAKTIMSIARVLSWNKKYKESMEWYDRQIDLNPEDPTPRKEKARVAYWGKFFYQSMSIYHSLLTPSVDELLMQDLQVIGEKNSSSCCSIDHIFQSIDVATSIYKAYETLSNNFIELSSSLSECQQLQIKLLLVGYLPLYLIQKSIKLESDAKSFDWDNYYLHALPIYRELFYFNPGNEEALFAYAQDFCNLGLCNCSRSLYRHLLNTNSNHDLAKMSLERNLSKEHSLLLGNYSYWAERGSGQFSNSQIARNQLDEVYEWSPSCSQQFRFMQHEWLEYPFFNQKYYPAEGQTLEINQTFNGYVKGVASITRKNYFQKFSSCYTCLGSLWFNLYDYAKLGVGFEKRNEIYNYFNLKQATQAKVSWISLSASRHSWVTQVTYRHLDYNDKNTLDHVNILASYLFSEDPKIFKVILNANYRNTTHLTETIFSPTGKIITIIHPYWTPRNYYSASLTFQFRYNYAWFTYCEAPQRYIDIKLIGEDDTSHNPSVQLIINWKHEFMYHFGFEITALYHRSKLWNADGIWTQLYYRF